MFGRQAVQSGARKSRVDQNHCLDDLFEGRMVKLKHKPKKKKKIQKLRNQTVTWMRMGSRTS